VAIREESFRIGSGRYIQGLNYADKCGREVLRLGNAPLIIGGATALSVAGEKIKRSVGSVCGRYEFITHTSTCNDEDAKALADYAKQNGYDVILGVGGGVIMDFAKLTAHYAELPIVNFPTSSATCAAYTPLSVRYTKDGRTVGTLHYEKEVDAVLVDTSIIAAEPTRLFLAGVFDSLAKFVEIKQRFNERSREYPLGLDYAYEMAKRSFSQLEKLTEVCIKKMSQGNIDFEVESIIFSTIAVPGIISGVARGSNQTALGHKFYEATRFLYPESASPYLHGEIVGVGLLMQNHYNGEEENNLGLLRLMNENGMPYRVSDLGIPKTDVSFENYYNYIVGSSAVNENDPEECARFRASLEYLWNII